MFKRFKDDPVIKNLIHEKNLLRNKKNDWRYGDQDIKTQIKEINTAIKTRRTFLRQEERQSEPVASAPPNIAINLGSM